jgi:hypothetical protein
MNERLPRAVHFNIDRLDLVGMPMSAVQSRQFTAAFTRHLQLLTRESSWTPTAAMAPTAIAPAVNVSKASTPASIGREVASALFDALRRMR